MLYCMVMLTSDAETTRQNTFMRRFHRLQGSQKMIRGDLMNCIA